MQEELIYKLKTLQSIEPDEVWQSEKKRKLLEKVSVFGVKNDIFLSSNDIYAKKTKFDLKDLVPNQLAVAFASIAVILSGGVMTVAASQSSLPGETLYPVKKVSEQLTLAVASDQDKPKIEIELAGKRLEELALVSQKASDSDQHQKIQQLVADFQEKVDSANIHLVQLNDKVKTDDSAKTRVINVAQVVSDQSEKYKDMLQKTTDSMPSTLKEKVADQVAIAAKVTEKTNLSALMVMVDNGQTQDNNNEIAARVQKTVENAEVKVNDISQNEPTVVADTMNKPAGKTTTKNAGCSDTPAASTEVKDMDAGNVAITEEAKKELEMAKENLKNNNLIDTLKSVEAVTEMADQVSSSGGEVKGAISSDIPAVTDPTAADGSNSQLEKMPQTSE